MLYIENQEQVSYMTSALFLSKRKFTCHGHVCACVYMQVPWAKYLWAQKAPVAQHITWEFSTWLYPRPPQNCDQSEGGLCGLTKNKNRGLGRWFSGQSVDHANMGARVLFPTTHINLMHRAPAYSSRLGGRGRRILTGLRNAELRVQWEPLFQKPIN